MFLYIFVISVKYIHFLSHMFIFLVARTFMVKNAAAVDSKFWQADDLC